MAENVYTTFSLLRLLWFNVMATLLNTTNVAQLQLSRYSISNKV
jgi:hypothetical protein